MVVIVNKDPHKSVVKEVICRKCGVTLSYVPIDIKESYSTDYTGGRDTYYFIKCPSCEHQVIVSF